MYGSNIKIPLGVGVLDKKRGRRMLIVHSSIPLFLREGRGGVIHEATTQLHNLKRVCDRSRFVENSRNRAVLLKREFYGAAYFVLVQLAT